MSETKIAAVGDRASVILFHTAGVTTRDVISLEEAESAVRELVVAGYNVIFITEAFIKDMTDLTEKYRREAYPALIPIPDRSGSMGLAEKKVIDNMEKAIGTNIFDK
ncbi:MAG: V-type ATP synthase subunit F [Clostridia bacterium]|nr:V-type ATP synthase subunit F [Clostridia bacterium]